MPLMPKVKAELERMERLGVISPITEPTEWYVGMVVVPKQGGKVRICVDLTCLNERATYPSSRRPDISTSSGSQGFLKTRCEFWLLASATSTRV